MNGTNNWSGTNAFGAPVTFNDKTTNKAVAYFGSSQQSSIDASGNFTGSGANLTGLPAANLTGTLPAISGANLTSLPAANLTGTLPAISGANLTSLPAANLTGTLPAISGANLTSLTGANISGVNSNGLDTLTKAQLARAGAVGYVILFQSTGSFTPAANSSYYYGGNPSVLPNNTAATGVFTNYCAEVPFAGTITRITLKTFIGGTLGTSEICTNQLEIQPLNGSSTNIFGQIYSAFNSISWNTNNVTVNQTVNAGDFICARFMTPASFGTTPTNIRFQMQIFIHQ